MNVFLNSTLSIMLGRLRAAGKRTYFLIGALIAAGALGMAAQDGSNAYSFLNVTSSARIYALGGVNITAIEDELSVTDQNPALLGPEMTNQILLDYMHYMGGSNFAGLRYARAVNDRGAWSAGIRYFGYGSIKGADEFGNLTGDFSPKDVSFNGSFSYDITERLRGGITLKLLYSGYEKYTSFAVSTDLGINYYDPDHDVSVSAVFANMGGQLKKFNENNDRLPFDIRLGIAKQFTGIPLRVSITAWNLTKWKLPYYNVGDGTSDAQMEEKSTFASNLFRHLVFGIDFVPSDRFWIGLGYNYKTRTDMSTYSRSFLSGFSIGAGINVRNFNVGLAFAQPHSGATTLMLNLNMNLNDFLN